MSFIVKGIDLPKRGETKRIVLYDNGDIVVDEDGWDEDGCRYYKTSYDIQAIQIPKGHGRLIDGDKLNKSVHEWSPAYTYGRSAFTREIGYAPTIVEAEEE